MKNFMHNYVKKSNKFAKVNLREAENNLLKMKIDSSKNVQEILKLVMRILGQVLFRKNLQTMIELRRVDKFSKDTCFFL